MLHTTPLTPRHRALGARMVDFGGWDMPLNYGSQIEEHHQVRRDAGMFDVSHMTVVDLSGENVRAFLRRLVANSVDKLTTSGKALYTCMLGEHGGVIDDLIVYYLTESRFRLVVNAAAREKDLAWINQHAQAFNVEVRERAELSMIAVQGPNARERTMHILPAHAAALTALKRFTSIELDTPYGTLFIARTGYTGEDGFEIILDQTHATALWDALLDVGVKPAGLGARDTLRLEAGLPLYGQDMDELTHPGEAALSWTVSLKDTARDFIGRAAIEQFPANKVLVGVKLNERGVLRAHMPVRTKQGVGELTSGSMSPTLGFSIGFARVPKGVEAGDSVEVEIRGKWLTATVAKPPFVRNGKAV